MSILNNKVKNKPLFGELIVGDIIYESYSSSDLIFEYHVTKIVKQDNDALILYYRDNFMENGQGDYNAIVSNHTSVLLRANMFDNYETYLTTYRPNNLWD